MKRPLQSLVALLLLGACTAPAVAAPRDEVLRLVPENVGFCFVVENLREHADAFLKSPFVAQFSQTALGRKLFAAPEIQVLLGLKRSFEKQLDVSFAQLRDEILGDAVVFAYRPGPPDKPELEQGLVVLRARDARLLARVIERINASQKNARELKEVETRTYRGVTYHQRLLRDGSNCYLLQDTLLVFATQEMLLREMIDRLQAAPDDNEAPVARQLRVLSPEKRLAALWINPRVFEPALRQRAAETEGLLFASPLKPLLDIWQTLDGVAVSVVLGKDLEIGLTLRGRFEQLPAAVRRFLTEAGKPTELWNRFPADALLTAACRVDLAALVEMFADFLPEPVRTVLRAAVERGLNAILSKDVLRDILPQIGPDLGLCVLKPTAQDKGCIPPLLFALRVQAPDTEASPARSLLNALHSFAALAVLSYNKLHPDAMTLRVAMHDKVAVWYLACAKLFPAGFQPSFALKDGYLVLASTPDAVRRFQARPDAPALSADEFPLVRLAPRALAAFLKDRRDALGAYLGEVHQLSRDEVCQRLDNLLLVLDLFERVEIVKRSVPGQVSLVLRVQTVQPLK